MPTVKNEKGEVISRQPYTAEGESRAQDIANTNPNWEIDYAPGGSFDAMGRSVTEYAGGGKVGYDRIGMYKKGGKVEKKAGRKDLKEKREGKETGRLLGYEAQVKGGKGLGKSVGREAREAKKEKEGK
jgi:hypothetical protein